MLKISTLLGRFKGTLELATIERLAFMLHSFGKLPCFKTAYYASDVARALRSAFSREVCSIPSRSCTTNARLGCFRDGHLDGLLPYLLGVYV